MVKEEHSVQNCSASDLMSAPSSLLWTLTHSGTNVIEDLFPASSLLAEENWLQKLWSEHTSDVVILDFLLSAGKVICSKEKYSFLCVNI